MQLSGSNSMKAMDDEQASAIGDNATKGISAAAKKLRMLKSLRCTDKHEKAARRAGARVVAGVDEVGRGALFGPVVAAAVVLPENIRRLAAKGLKDSKQLEQADRERLAEEVYAVALAVSVAEVDAATIDAVNIYQASRQAMLRAVLELKHEATLVRPDHLLIDAMQLDIDCAQTKLFYGDALSLSIAAASVVAKVHRDRRMRELDAEYPQYGLASHKGYGTPQHLAALREHGPCALHRRSFAPVANWHDISLDEEALNALAEIAEED